MKTIAADTNEAGFASLIVGITLVIIIGLLTVGFATLMTNEQKQVANRQLSDQAYYAAETGINDATKALASGYSTDKETCPAITPASPDYTTPGAKYLSNPNVDTPSGSTDVQWTCLLVNPKPPSLKYQPDINTPTNFTTFAANSSGTLQPIDHLMIYWQDLSPSQQQFRSCGNFPAYASWGATGMVRVAITKLPSGAVDPTNLYQNTFTTFLCPSSSSSPSAAANFGNPAAQGPVLNGGCSITNISPPSSWPSYCGVQVNVGLGAGTPLLFNLRSLYSTTNVVIEAFSGAASNSSDQLDLLGAQTLVDSTGRDQDVLKRIQVRIPDKDDFDYPGYVLGSMNGVCKQMVVYPGSVTDNCDPAVNQ